MPTPSYTESQVNGHLVANVQYDATNQRLQIQYQNGSIGSINGVPPSLGNAVIVSSDPLTYIRANILPSFTQTFGANQ